MYSLKWYRDNVEFYRKVTIWDDHNWDQNCLSRYIPTEDPSTTVFVMPGLEVKDKFWKYSEIDRSLLFSEGPGSLHADPHHPQQRGLGHQRRVQVRGLRWAAQVLHSLKDDPPPDCGWVYMRILRVSVMTSLDYSCERLGPIKSYKRMKIC